MARKNEPDMSELERELEVEMEEDRDSIEEKELDEEFKDLAEIEEEKPEEENEKPEEEYGDYAERFYELSLREYESEAEVDDAVNKLFNEMERDFFFKGLWKKIKRGGKWLLKKGVKLAKGLPVFQAVKGITQLVRGNLRGLLASLVKAALGGAVKAIPGGAAILPAVKALGFEAAEDPETNKEAWSNFVTVAQEAYDYLARNLDENSDDPVAASRLASEAFHTALRRIHAARKPYRVIHVKRGDGVL